MKKTTTTKSRKTTAKKKTTRQPLTTYVPVSDNIYHDGSSYRVRVSVNGNKVSKSFSNKRKAVQFRNELFSQQG